MSRVWRNVRFIEQVMLWTLRQKSTMSYSVYVQKFDHGEPANVPYSEVASVLSQYGTIDRVGSRMEFNPHEDNLCEVGFLSGNESDGIDGIDGISFERPVAGRALPDLIFRLLNLPSICFFELDCTYVLAKADITADLPEGLLEQCESGRVTVISSVEEIVL